MVKKITNTCIIDLYLNDYSKKYYLRELASLLKKPHQTIKPYVESLVKAGVLVKNERMNIVEYNLNFKNKKIYDYLIIAEKEKLIFRIEEDPFLKVLFEKLSSFFRDNTFVVFGSSVSRISKGSDIDMLVVGKNDISKEKSDFEKVYNKKIHDIILKNLEGLDLSLAKEIYKKHLILNNTEQIIRFFGGLYEQNKLV